MMYNHPKIIFGYQIVKNEMAHGGVGGDRRGAHRILVEKPEGK
jgi:hypothetical protein